MHKVTDENDAEQLRADCPDMRELYQTGIVNQIE